MVVKVDEWFDCTMFGANCFGSKWWQSFNPCQCKTSLIKPNLPPERNCHNCNTILDFFPVHDSDIFSCKWYHCLKIDQHAKLWKCDNSGLALVRFMSYHDESKYWKDNLLDIYFLFIHSHFTCQERHISPTTSETVILILLKSMWH